MITFQFITAKLYGAATTMAHSSFPCFSDCVSYAVRKLQMTNITLKADCVVRRSLTPAAVQEAKKRFQWDGYGRECSVSLAEFQEVCARLSLAGISEELDALLQADSVGARGTIIAYIN